jgi:hypothetical protein
LSPIVIGIIAGLSVFILSNIIGYFVRKYFFFQPKIIINFQNTSNSSSLENNNKLRLLWNYDIIFKNVTKYDAISLSVDFNDFPSNYVTKQKFTHIKGLTEEILKLHFYETYERDVVEKTKNRFKELIPKEFDNAKIVLTYSNEMNKRFYTKYLKISEAEKNIFYKRKPKIKKNI